MNTDGIVARHKVIYALRQTAEKYNNSSNPHDVQQGRTLEEIANAIYSKDLEDAVLRYDALHNNIKTTLPFFVLDYLDRAEKHIDI